MTIQQSALAKAIAVFEARVQNHMFHNMLEYAPMQLSVVKINKDLPLSNYEAKWQERIAVHNSRTLAGSGDTREVNDWHKQLSQNQFFS